MRPITSRGRAATALRRAMVVAVSAPLWVAGAATAQGRESPPFVLPIPTGQWAVGTNQFLVPSGIDGESNRTLTVITWYPVTDTAGRARAPYLREEAALRAMAALGRNPAAAALSAAPVVTHAWLDAPIASRGTPFPVVVFSHGYLGMPSDYTALMEELASHGFAVFSIAHSGESMARSSGAGAIDLLVGPDNRLKPRPAGVLGEWSAEDSIATVVTTASDSARANAALRWYLARIPHSTDALARWVEDTRRVVDAIAQLPAARRGAGQRIDLTRLAAVGHSMGGVTSAAYCAVDTRCRAAINLDGSPQYGALIDHPSRAPTLMVYSARPGRVGVNDPIYGKGGAYTRAVVAGTLHLNFGDWQYWGVESRLAAALGTIPAERATLVVHRLVREYLGATLEGTPSPLLAGTDRLPELAVQRIGAGAR